MSVTRLTTPALLPESLLTPEQNEAIDRLFEHDETLLIAGVGFGKAIVGLTAARDLLAAGEVRRVLVLAPLKVATLTWGTEPAKWAHIRDDLVAVACGAPTRRNAAVASGARVVVTNFENAVWMLENHGDQFDALLIDEITKLKTVSGTAAKKLRYWVKGLKWRAGMSASPVAESGADIYGQALLLDLGKALGTRKQAFLEKYLVPVDYERRKWVLPPGGELAMALPLQRLVYYANDASYREGLPRLDVRVRELALPEAGQALYDTLARNKVLPEQGVVARSAGVLTNKLYQIAAGGLYAGDAEDRELVWFDPYKIDWACDVVARLPQMHCAVIVYTYTFELDELRKRFPTAPVLGGGAKFTDRDLAAWSKRHHKVLLMHPKSAAHGLNLQYGGHTLIQLSPIWGADPAAQIVGRLRRRGQPSDVVTQHVAVARGTKDEDALAGLEFKGGEEDRAMKQFKK